MRKKINAVLLSLVFSIIFANFAPAQDIAKVKKQMKTRLPAIAQLKVNGIIGENNTGYLQYMGANHEKQDLINAENRDRKTVYTWIAGQQGSTEVMVGKRRAAKMSKISATGLWLQKPSGQWYKK